MEDFSGYRRCNERALGFLSDERGIWRESNGKDPIWGRTYEPDNKVHVKELSWQVEEAEGRRSVPNEHHDFPETFLAVVQPALSLFDVGKTMGRISNSAWVAL